MKVIKKNVYYCDYCNKRLLSASWMSRHEKHCTANPNRECRTCEMNPDISTYIEELKRKFEIIDTERPISDYMTDIVIIDREVKWHGKPITLEEIIDHVEGCPNCILSILRQTRLNYEVFGFKYDYQTEFQSYWKEKNNENYHDRY